MTYSPADVGLLTPTVAGTAVEGLTGDDAVQAAMLRAEAALLRALAEVGIAPEYATAAAHRVEMLEISPRELATAAGAGGNPVIPLVERLREAVDPQAAQWVHHGATSQDILDTALMLVSQHTMRQVESDLTALAATLAATAKSLREVPAVARTLSQQALPTTMGLRVAGWLCAVHDALQAVGDLRLPASLGGPVGTASAYGEQGPAVLTAYADRLGLVADVADWHTRRTPLLTLNRAAAAVAAACGSLAADVVRMAQTEVGEAAEATGGGSSSMPHKANPAQSVLVLAAARQVPPLTATLSQSAIAPTERPAGPWHAEWQPLRMLLRLTGAITERSETVAAGLRFDQVAIRRNLDSLTRAVDADDAWVAQHTAAAAAQVDRVLHEHERLLR